MKHLLQSLPQIHQLLQDEEFKDLQKEILKPIIQELIQSLRQQINNQEIHSLCLNTLKSQIKHLYTQRTSSTIAPLINATGVVLQTNLGRSLFSEEILQEVLPLLQTYNNLEYDITKGKRSERYIHISHLLCTLLGCEDAIVVNNNASAVLLVLNTFGANQEVIISRGELVEIGGAFRIPEVMKLSNSKLIEVGTTNKTHLKDYEEAISPQTALLMKAHQSNFRQIGFCSSVEFEELTKLATKHNIIDYYDLGSGYMKGLQTKEEPSILEICSKNPSLLSFSGDKLFGGPQAGVIVGKKHLIDKLKKNHLLRALRVDKFTILTLEATLRAYLNQEFHKIPTLSMLNLTQEELLSKAKKLHSLLDTIPNLKCQISPVDSLAGGGSLPQTPFHSYAVLLHSPLFKTSSLETQLRQKRIITRIISEQICLDLRCLFEKDFELIAKTLKEIVCKTS